MVRLKINLPEYENEARALLMAFFYGKKIVSSDEPGEYSAGITILLFKVQGGTDMVHVSAYVSGKESLSDAAECDLSDRSATGNVMKRLLHGILSELTGRATPWGILTGVRPSKIPMTYLERGMSPEDSAKELESEYLIAPERAKMLTRLAEKERGLLSGISFMDSWSLYAGIPFCPSICAYCSFSSFPIEKWKDEVESYIDALLKEMAAAKDMMSGRKLLTVYFGGGTPTSISSRQLYRVMEGLHRYFDLSETIELTVEAGRPDSVDLEKLKVLKDAGVGRISVNPQSMNAATLEIIGRRHSPDDVKNAFGMAREAGFDNINMDIIAGLPGEDNSHMTRTVAEIKELGPDSLTVHCLALKRASFLNQNREKFPVAGDSEIMKMTETAREGAIELGMEPYYLYRQKNIAGNLENTGYALRGKECLYNILIMEEKQSILALGAGGSSKFVLPGTGKGPRIERVMNVKSVRDYIDRIDEMILRKEDFLGSN
ncbi:MAG: coproporphyrinogen dehydrogenase HemZ [Lachnospiraceae bacterium]|nr:coproporphyrinogen dehydrogenase HemZ [Lachnospiraceae bacterium]